NLISDSNLKMASPLFITTTLFRKMNIFSTKIDLMFKYNKKQLIRINMDTTLLIISLHQLEC
ncbi:hypothetical protein, partial [Bacillus thuringiensis]|uniref:hypothetical protein n=1 Tax=Bacillus thuringiensis TaxID=1428 RepID=UPI001C3F3136